MAVEKFTMVKRTIWTIKCDDCGQRKEWTEKPPKATRCACNKWHTPEMQTFTSQEYSPGANQ